MQNAVACLHDASEVAFAVGVDVLSSLHKRPAFPAALLGTVVASLTGGAPVLRVIAVAVQVDAGRLQGGRRAATLRVLREVGHVLVQTLVRGMVSMVF